MVVKLSELEKRAINKKPGWINALKISGNVNGDSLTIDEESARAVTKLFLIPAKPCCDDKPASAKRSVINSCFGLGDLIYYAVKPLTLFSASLRKCTGCKVRRKRWNRFRVCWR